MRVAQAQRQQLATFFNDDAVGTWRQGQDARPFGGLLDQQSAVRGAVEHAELAVAVQGDEALATLFGIDLYDRRLTHPEGTDLLEALLAIRVAGHEPLGQAALGIADDQRDTPHQLSGGGDFAVRAFGQFVAAIETLVAQAEDIGGGATVDHIQPLLTRVDEDVLHHFGHLRQFDTALFGAGLAGQHVFAARQLDHLQVRTRRASQQQGVAIDIDTHMLQRAALLVENERRLAIWVIDAWGDGLLVIRIGDFVGVVEHQRLTIGQTDCHQRAARLVRTDRSDLRTWRQWQVDAA